MARVVANETFVFGLKLVAAHMWPEVEIEVETFKDYHSMRTIIRWRVPTPSGGVAYVTDIIDDADLELRTIHKNKYRMKLETIATITLLLG